MSFFFGFCSLSVLLKSGLLLWSNISLSPSNFFVSVVEHDVQLWVTLKWSSLQVVISPKSNIQMIVGQYLFYHCFLIKSYKTGNYLIPLQEIPEVTTCTNRYTVIILCIVVQTYDMKCCFKFRPSLIFDSVLEKECNKEGRRVECVWFGWRTQHKQVPGLQENNNKRDGLKPSEPQTWKSTRCWPASSSSVSTQYIFNHLLCLLCNVSLVSVVLLNIWTADCVVTSPIGQYFHLSPSNFFVSEVEDDVQLWIISHFKVKSFTNSYVIKIQQQTNDYSSVLVLSLLFVVHCLAQKKSRHLALTKQIGKSLLLDNYCMGNYLSAGSKLFNHSWCNE